MGMNRIERGELFEDSLCDVCLELWHSDRMWIEEEIPNGGRYTQDVEMLCAKCLAKYHRMMASPPRVEDWM
jgi:hypothetical protein